MALDWTQVLTALILTIPGIIAAWKSIQSNAGMKEVHKLVNSQLTDSVGRYKAAEKEISVLKKVLRTHEPENPLAE